LIRAFVGRTTRSSGLDIAEDRQQARGLGAGITHRRRHRAALRAILYRHHHGLPLLIPALPETVAGAPGQREDERQDSQNAHDLIS
jgi:hypothetical protein